MADEPNEPAQPPAAPPSPVAAPAAPPVDVDKIRRDAAKAAKAEADAAFKTMLDEAAAEAERDKLSEADRAKADAAKALEEAAKVKAEAERERFAAHVERMLSAEGVPTEALPRVLRGMEVQPGASDDEITAEIAEIRKTVPGWFAQKPGAPLTPVHTPPPARTTTTAASPEFEAARLRHGKPVNAA
jgi:hypothetical protein